MKVKLIKTSNSKCDRVGAVGVIYITGAYSYFDRTDLKKTLSNALEARWVFSQIKFTAIVDNLMTIETKNSYYTFQIL